MGAPRARHGTLLAAVSGLAVGATFSPFGGPVLPFVAFAPLAVALDRSARAAAARPLAPFAHGFTTAAVAHGIGLYWMVPALRWRTILAVPLYLLMVVMIAVLAGAACKAAADLRRRRRWPLPLALAACWTGFEWAAAHVPGISYAWLNTGGSLAWYPSAAAGSELLGARILTFWTVAIGAGLGVAAPTFAPGAATRALARPFLLLGAVVLPLASGHIRQRGFEGGEVAVRVAAVQAGHGAGRIPASEAAALSRWLGPLRRLEEAEGFDLAVFPERYLAVPLKGAGGEAPTDAGKQVADFAGALGSATVVGALDRVLRDGGGRDTLWYNAAFLQVPGQPLSPAYRKSRLVPGLEGAGWWPDGVPGLPGRGYAPGRNLRPLTLGDGAVGVMICYDSAYGETARALVRAGADWLAVLSNDDWLDPALPFTETWAYWQHATHGRLRAIENRVSLIQVAATGYTFAVSPGGAGSRAVMEPGAEGVAVVTAMRRSGTTVYTRTGDVLGLACFVIFALGVLLGVRGRKSPLHSTGDASRLEGALSAPLRRSSLK